MRFRGILLFRTTFDFGNLIRLSTLEISYDFRL
nr:MAG TPA: hypothetical protein [Caudoviricetes sp.]